MQVIEERCENPTTKIFNAMLDRKAKIYSFIITTELDNDGIWLHEITINLIQTVG